MDDQENIMEKRRGLNLVGLYEKLVGLAGGPREPVSLEFTARDNSELRRLGKAPAKKKRHRKAVQASRGKNRG
jgi:hypothetical protein